METNITDPFHSAAPPNFWAQSRGASATKDQRTSATIRPLSREKVPASRGKNFLIASSDINSFAQHLADSIFIVTLSILTGIAYEVIAYRTVAPPRIQIYLGLMAAIAFGIVVRNVGGGRHNTVTNAYERLHSAVLAWTLAFGTMSFGLFLLKVGEDASRGGFLTFYLAGLPALALWRVFVPVEIVPIAKHAGVAKRECIIIGDIADPHVEKFAEQLKVNGHPVPNILKFRAFCLASQWQNELDKLSDRVAHVAHHAGPGEIYVCAGSVPSDRLASIGRRLTLLPRSIYIIPDAQTAALVRCKPLNVGGYVVLEARREPLGVFQRAVKRLMDVAVSAALLAVLAPLFLLVAVLIKLDSKGPVLFRQTRNGYRGRRFEILKFRSMHVQENGPVIRQATRGDARVTRIGRFLRKLSIDELPQLVNILVGDMSLVGPRPHALAHDAFYAETIQNYEIRQHVKPGLTGWAQVNGLRGETASLDAMHRRIEYDLWYAVNASILLDIEILARTAIEVARSRNAY